MLADISMLSPLPKKPAHGLQRSPASPTVGAEELASCRPFWYEGDADEAAQDLQELMRDGYATPTSKTTLPAWMPAFEARCLSSASTAAATSSPPFSPSPPSTPERTRATSDLNDDIESPDMQASEPPRCPPGALDKTSWLQARKIFVGGLPQTVDQNGLYQMFSKYGKVKKAWLQLFHTDCAAGQAQAGKKHRGFGFVVFYEKHSIDDLLGDEFSRFVCFGDSLKLEVKRAVGKEKQPQEHSSGVKLHRSPAPVGLQPGPVPAPTALSNCSTPSPSRANSKQEVLLNVASTPSSHVLRGIVTEPSQRWQCSPTQPQPVFVTYVVPPFPVMTPPVVQATTPPVQTLQQETAFTPLSDYQPGATAPIVQVPVPNFQLPQATLQELSNVLLDGYCGLMPQTSQELTNVLLEALPDCYDD